jgi:hypothetical protein
MHDPMVVAFEIRSPIKRRGGVFPEGHRGTLATVWHCDPCRDGTDDSCGWFARARHGDPDVLRKIKSFYEFNWDADYGSWFDATGYPRLSTIGIALQMFRGAAWEHFRHSRAKTDRFLKRHLYDILSFAENTVDSLHPSIVGKYGFPERSERISHFASVVYGCVLRWTRPWWRHPRWHVHHWQIQIIPLRTFKRWLFSRCAVCGKRFSWGESPVAYGGDDAGPRWFRGEPNIHHAGCISGSSGQKSSSI